MVKEKNSRSRNWNQDPEAVKSDILETATAVFSESGYSGARIEEIVRRTRTSKRMIYYYFTDKRGLFVSVIEAAYAKLRAQEVRLKLDDLAPIEALRNLIEFTFDYHNDNPEYVRLIQIENIHGAKNFKASDQLSSVNVSAIEMLRTILNRGVKAGQFRSGIDPLELHWLITSSCVFNITNRPSFQQLYGDKLFTAKGQKKLKKLVASAVLNLVCK